MPETAPETFNCILCEKPTPLSAAVSMGEEDACPACAEICAAECQAITEEFEASKPAWTLRAETYIPGAEGMPGADGMPLEIRFVTTDGKWRLDWYPENDSWAAQKIVTGDTTGYRYDDPTEVGVPAALIAVRDAFYGERDRALDAEAKAGMLAFQLGKLTARLDSVEALVKQAPHADHVFTARCIREALGSPIAPTPEAPDAPCN